MEVKNEITFAFWGSGTFSLCILESLFDGGFVPSLIVAPPDRPCGRGQKVTPPNTKIWAAEKNIPCIQPTSLEPLPPEISNKSWDVFIVVSYGRLLPKEVLACPERGVLNVHPSLLPLLRGPSPIPSSILHDMNETGVTIMLLDERMDHGPIVSQARIEIDRDDWPLSTGQLTEILAQAGGETLLECLPDWLNGAISPEEQDHERTTYTKKFSKEDAYVDITENPYLNLLKVKAFDENPTAWTYFKKRGEKIRVKITDAEIQGEKLVLKRIIPEGKKEMDAKDFLGTD